MSIASNKELGSRFFQEQDRLRGGPAEELCAPSYTAYIASSPPRDLAGHQQFAKVFYGAFPDLRHVIEETVADEAKVAVRFTLHGTHTGNFLGISVTGKKVVIPALAILHVADGKVTELRALFDQVSLLQQLGALPS